MNFRPMLTISIVTFLTFTSLSLLGCGGCAPLSSSESQEKVANSSPSSHFQSPNNSRAEQIFSILAFEDAIQKENALLFSETWIKIKQNLLPPDMYAKAAVFLISKRSPLADEVLAAGLKNYPEDSLLNLLYAESMLDSEEKSAGLEHMKHYADKHPDNVNAQMELALLLIKNDNFSKAEEILKRIPEKKRSAESELYHAKALIGQKKGKLAEKHLQKALIMQPDFVEAYAELAYQYEKEADWHHALANYEKIRQIRGNSPELILRLIHVYLRLNQEKMAWDILKEGTEDLDFQMAAAALFMDFQKFSSAENLFLAILAKPDAPDEIFLYLAEVTWQKNHNANKSIDWLNKIPVSAQCHLHAALFHIQLLFEAKQPESALKILPLLQEQHPDSPELSLAEARILASMKKIREALKTTENAFVRWPNNPDVLFLLATIQDETGQKDKALQSMESLIKLNPEHYQALNYIGYTLAEQGKDLARAQELLKKALKISPESAYIWDSLAWAQFKDGKLKEAWECIEKAVTLDNTAEATIWEHRGDIAKSLQYIDKSRESYNKALKNEPQNPETIQKKLLGL